MFSSTHTSRAAPVNTKTRIWGGGDEKPKLGKVHIIDILDWDIGWSSIQNNRVITISHPPRAHSNGPQASDVGKIRGKPHLPGEHIYEGLYTLPVERSTA